MKDNHFFDCLFLYILLIVDIIKKYNFMKYLEKYKHLIFKPKTNTFWFIKGDFSEVYNTLLKITKEYLFTKDSEKSYDMLKTILNYKDVECIGFFIYYSTYGFSYSIIKDMNDMMNVYKSHTKAGVYKYIGDLKIVDDKQIQFDTHNKKFLEDTIKYNL